MNETETADFTPRRFFVLVDGVRTSIWAETYAEAFEYAQQKFGEHRVAHTPERD